jgi:hypothetical protein
MKRLVRSRNLLVRSVAVVALAGFLMLSSAGTSNSNALDSCCSDCLEAYQECINGGGIPGDCCCFYLGCISGCSLWCPEACPSCS